jgi:MerR family transcriptional regulator, light-induced transcriptional regulator
LLFTQKEEKTTSMSQYSIKDLEKLTGVKAHTIRIWEKRYGIVHPSRTETNIRTYSNCDLKRLLNISILNKRGCRISNLASLSVEELNERVMSLMADHHAYENQIENLIMAMIDMNETRFEKTLSNSVIEMGFEETLIRIVYPFFFKTGILWQTGAIGPAQEHFVSNLVRQKIIAAIDNLESKYPPKAKLFILFLRDDEYHELGLLFFHYLIKKVGHRIIYLGQSTPMEDVIKAAAVHDPDFLFTSFTQPIADSDLGEYMEKLLLHFPKKGIFVTGLQLSEGTNCIPEGITHVNEPQTFKQELINFLR